MYLLHLGEECILEHSSFTSWYGSGKTLIHVPRFIMIHTTPIFKIVKLKVPICMNGANQNMIKPYMDYLTAIKNERIYVYLYGEIPKVLYNIIYF